MEASKPGVKTSEFWMSLGSMVLMLLVAVGIIQPDSQAQLQSSVGEIVGAVEKIVAIVGSIGVAISYIWGRSWLKAKTAAEIKNGSTQ